MKFQITLTVLFISYFAQSQNTISEQIDLELLQGNYSKAIELADTDIEQNGTSSEIIYRKSLALRELYEYKKAIQTISLVLDDSKNDKQILVEYGRLLIHNSQKDSAINVFQYVYNQIDSSDIKNNTLLARCYEKDKDYKNTERLYRQLCLTVPDNTHFRYKQAQAYVNMRNGKDAIPLLNYNLLLDSTHINSRYLLFKIYRAVEKLDIAIAHMDTLKKLEPNNPDWYYITAQAHYSRNHNYLAIPQLQKAMDLGKKDPEILALLGNCYFNIKKYEQALPYLTLNGEDEMDGARLLKIAQSYLQLEKLDSAKIYFNRTFQASMPQPFTLAKMIQGMADVEKQKGNFNKALAHYEHGIELAKGLMYERFMILEDIKYMADIYENDLNQPQVALELYESQIAKFKKENNPYIVKDLQSEKNRLNEKIFFESKN